MSLERQLTIYSIIYLPDARSNYIRTVNLLKPGHTPQNIHPKCLTRLNRALFQEIGIADSTFQDQKRHHSS